MKKQIKNKNIKKVQDFLVKTDSAALHPISNFATSFEVKRKRKTISITLELPVNEISSKGEDVCEIIDFDVFQKSEMPIIPMLITFDNK